MCLHSQSFSYPDQHSSILEGRKEERKDGVREGGKKRGGKGGREGGTEGEKERGREGEKEERNVLHPLEFNLKRRKSTNQKWCIVTTQDLNQSITK